MLEKLAFFFIGPWARLALCAVLFAAVMYGWHVFIEHYREQGRAEVRAELNQWKLAVNTAAQETARLMRIKEQTALTKAETLNDETINELAATELERDAAVKRLRDGASARCASGAGLPALAADPRAAATASGYWLSRENATAAYAEAVEFKKLAQRYNSLLGQAKADRLTCNGAAP